eukprot:6519048-Pyramimonas_sp.AAC.1
MQEDGSSPDDRQPARKRKAEEEHPESPGSRIMAIIQPILNIGEDQYLCEEPEPHSTDLCLTNEELLKHWCEGV